MYVVWCSDTFGSMLYGGSNIRKYVVSWLKHSNVCCAVAQTFESMLCHGLNIWHECDRRCSQQCQRWCLTSYFLPRAIVRCGTGITFLSICNVFTHAQSASTSPSQTHRIATPSIIGFSCDNGYFHLNSFHGSSGNKRRELSIVVVMELHWYGDGWKCLQVAPEFQPRQRNFLMT